MENNECPPGLVPAPDAPPGIYVLPGSVWGQPNAEEVVFEFTIPRRREV